MPTPPDRLPRLRTVLLALLVAALLAGIGAWAGGLLARDIEIPTFSGNSSSGSSSGNDSVTALLDAPGASTIGTRASPDSAVSTLETLRVAPPDRRADYDRDTQFGRAWRDPDRNRCDARQDTLNRQARAVLARDRQGCVTRATILDPYTGNQLTGGPGVQIDHVVALADVWRTGGQNLTQAERYEIANTPSNLIATTPRENQTIKRDDAADAYLPPDPGYRCDYVARQIGVKAHYRLSVTPAERDAMRRVLTTCPRVPLPADLQRGRIAR